MEAISVVIIVLTIVYILSTVSCFRAAGKADEWIREILRKENKDFN